MKSYFRPEIDAMAGYVPGEQPKMANLVKLNTNENPYPASPRVREVIAGFDHAKLRRYPEPMADTLRDEIAGVLGVKRENIIAGNGSDDILTMTFRAFTAPDRPLACLDPTYSLYFELAKMQGAPVIRIGLDPEDFSMPENLLEQAADANLLIITRPNAPTGNSFDRERMCDICRKFDGIVFFDEAYADFAEDNCMEFATEFDNVIVSRTFSKSYSLAGLRLGYAVGNPKVIEGLFKLKDSYNLDMLTQEIGRAAFADRDYLRECCEQVKATRRLSRRGAEEDRFPGGAVADQFPVRGSAGRRWRELFPQIARAGDHCALFPGGSHRQVCPDHHWHPGGDGSSA